MLPTADRAPRLALVLFFLSGFAALLYQVIWQRLLAIFSGADIYSVTVIVAAFMAGLGLGSLAGGHVADRLGARANLFAFAAAELCVGAFALASKPIYYDVLYSRFPHLSAAPGTAATVLFASLLPPTFLMGASLPLVARALTGRVHAAGRVIGSLYGWNTLGAAAGALVGTWVVLPRLGMERALWAGAAISGTCAILACWLARASTPARASQTVGQGPTTAASHIAAREGEAAVTERGALPFRMWAIVFAIAGFVALGLEIVWFRLLGVVLKSTTFTFGTLLGIYLAGIGLGAAVASGRVDRSARPGTMFLVLQCAVATYAAVSTIGLMALLASGHPVKLVRYLATYEPVDVYGTVAQLSQASLFNPSSLTPIYELAVLYVVVPAALIGLPTFLMGMSFPYLQRAAHEHLFQLGRRLGALLAMNIAGSASGAMVTGWVLLPALGTAGTLKALVGLAAVLLVPAAQVLRPASPRVRAIAWTGAVVAIAGLIASMPDGATLWARLHGASARDVLIAEDGAGVAVLKAEGASLAGDVGVYVSGLGQSWIPYGGIHTALGALPALLHSNPADALVIGLGSGDTAFAVTGRPEVRRLVVVEIIGAQRGTLQQLANAYAYPGLVSLLSDPRVEHRTGDGRAYILQAGRRFDIIEADALRPTSAYAGNLYSREYFALLLRHLAPGGLAVTWAPTARVQRTFASVFPYVLGFGDIYLGSNQPIPFDPATLAARATAARAFYAAAGIDIVAVLQPYWSAPPLSIGPNDARDLDDLNTDVFPRDELALPF